MKPGRILWTVLLCLRTAALIAQDGRPLAWGDQNDGTYRNPILKSDYSDPDILRRGEDFYLVASDFHFVGLQVLHSRDLVNWEIIGRVFDRLAMSGRYDDMKGYGQGIWAPALRYHGGEFYIFACTPGEGLFMWHAKDPAGPWSETVTVRSVAGWEDPCPFWDDDGRAYLVHSRVGAGPIILHRMSLDGSTLLDEGAEIYHGDTSEGPKLYKRHGYYYVSLPEGGVRGGWQTVLRSPSIYGPYERRQVFPPGSPHQGGMVELDSGETWFVSFKAAGYLGRICYLNPVRWVDDWPVFGDGGQPVDAWRKPNVGRSYPIVRPAVGDEFDGRTLSLFWQWNHNPIPGSWSLTERPGWLRIAAQPASGLAAARDTLTARLWDDAGVIDVKMDAAMMKDGQRAGFAFMSGSDFGWIGVGQENGARRIVWDQGEGPVLGGHDVWFRGIHAGDAGRLLYSLDGKNYVEPGKPFRLAFRFWKGARLSIFSYGPNGGAADFDYVRYRYGAGPDAAGSQSRIDRLAWVMRHNPELHEMDVLAPLTVGNGGFAFGADITGLQTFAADYQQRGIPVETLARWCWHSQANPGRYRLEDTDEDFRLPDGRLLRLPTRQSTPAGDWLRRNPHLQPLGQLALQWLKPDTSALAPGDIRDPVQTLDLWRGVISSRFRLSGAEVSVTTVCAPDSDTVGVRIRSPLVKQGKLRVRLGFPAGYERAPYAPALDWGNPQAHESKLERIPGGALIRRRIGGTQYAVVLNAPVLRIGPHLFAIAGGPGSETLEFAVQFLPAARPRPVVPESVDRILRDSARRWEKFWEEGAAVDFSGSSSPLAQELEQRIVLSAYLMAVQMAGTVPPQESGLTCSTWYGKHHSEMIWWHAAHFSLWGHDDLLASNLEWYRAHLPEARALAARLNLRGARWAKMVGPEDRESPGGNPLIVWNQPHMIYLCELLYRSRPDPGTLEKYRELVLETADCLASMLSLDNRTGRYTLGPPLWISQEIYEPASSRNPAFELSYWRWALGTAQQWRERLHLPRETKWDDILARLSPLPVSDGKYVALESHPDTWINAASRHDHPSMLMPLGMLPGGPDVDRGTMSRTLDAVLQTWNWEEKIWGWDYPMIAMTAARLGRPDLAVEVLLRDGPNNRYFASGHCPQQGGGRRPGERIPAYLPANGALLSAVALMVAGWDGCPEVHPGIPKDGAWTVRAEGLRPLP